MVQMVMFFLCINNRSCSRLMSHSVVNPPYFSHFRRYSLSRTITSSSCPILLLGNFFWIVGSTNRPPHCPSHHSVTIMHWFTTIQKNSWSCSRAKFPRQHVLFWPWFASLIHFGSRQNPQNGQYYHFVYTGSAFMINFRRSLFLENKIQWKVQSLTSRELKGLGPTVALLSCSVFTSHNFCRNLDKNSNKRNQNLCK